MNDRPPEWFRWPLPARAHYIADAHTRAELFALVAEEIGVEWDADRQNDPRFRKRELARIYALLSSNLTPPGREQ